MKRIPLYKFFKHKYGAELLVDVVNLDKMKPDIHRTPVYRETFYSLLLITSGSEAVTINDRTATVSPGCVLTSIPGEIWAMSTDSKLEALNLIFEEEFLLDFFSDTHFLDHFRYLQADRPSPFLILDGKLNDRLLQLYLDMQREIHRPAQDQHILRAMLYEALMLLNRAQFTEENNIEPEDNETVNPNQYIDSFRSLVEEHYKEEHGVSFYADRLFITSNYLNKLVRSSLGVSTKQYVLSRIMQEACNLLRYTSLSVQDIAAQLHFETATYFTRIFYNYKKQTPLSYRNNAK
ncbi:MAG: AraC family transcriptional regulator [Prevotella sp.]|nr:AraC family transcriptional regulator [Bacteroidales bacterium]MDY4228905.1 AraC family transcriptional regulator [Prevotella sp.]